MLHAYKSYEELPKIYQKALQHHKFDHEIYVPTSMQHKRINKSESKNCWRNRLISNANQQKEEWIAWKELKKETRAFSQKYKSIWENEKSSAYNKQFSEIYRLKGYVGESLNLKENIFLPSILLGSQGGNFNWILKTEPPKHLGNDKKFLENIEETLKEITINSTNMKENGLNVEMLSSWKSERIHQNGDGLCDDLPSLKQLEKENCKWMREIWNTKLSWREFGEIEQNGAKTSRNNKINSRNFRNDKANSKKIVRVDGIFLSSKGMLRSANKGKQGKSKITSNITTVKEHLNGSQSYRGVRTLPNKYRDENLFTPERKNLLERWYKEVSKASYMKKEEELKRYNNKYMRSKVEQTDPNKGSNLHNFYSQFSARSAKINFPELVRWVNDKNKDYGKTEWINHEDAMLKEEKIQDINYDNIDKLLYQKYVVILCIESSHVF